MFRYLTTVLLCPGLSVTAPLPVFDSVEPDLIGEEILSVYYSPPWGSYFVSAQTISIGEPAVIDSIEVPARWDGELEFYQFVIAVHSSLAHFGSLSLDRRHRHT